LRGELQAAEREKKEAKVLFIFHGYKNMLKTCIYYILDLKNLEHTSPMVV